MVLSGISLSGCTPEKAQALKNAATSFQTEAAAALSDVDTILKAGIEMPPQDVNSIVADLETFKSDFSSDALQQLLSEGQLGEKESKEADKAIADIQAAYNRFAIMFDSLPKGSFFAIGEVDKAKKYAVNLTVQMVNLANMLEQNKILVKFNSRRILLVEQIKQHSATADAKQKHQNLLNDAQQIMTLRDDEAKARDQAIAQCLKAAQAGHTITQLINDYGKLSLSEILTIAQDSLSSAAQISNQNASLVSFLGKYNNVVTTLQSDSNFSPLLDVKVTPTPAPANPR